VVLALLAFPRIEAFPDHSNDEGALTVTLERIDRAPEPQAEAAAASEPARTALRLSRLERTVDRVTEHSTKGLSARQPLHRKWRKRGL
jgi:hypothetical protein